MKKSKLPVILICTALFLSGCKTVSRSYEKAEAMARKKSNTVFNPKAVYQIPPGGAWLEDLVDIETEKRQGPIFVPGGTIVYYDADVVDGEISE